MKYFICLICLLLLVSCSQSQMYQSKKPNRAGAGNVEREDPAKLHFEFTDKKETISAPVVLEDKTKITFTTVTVKETTTNSYIVPVTNITSFGPLSNIVTTVKIENAKEKPKGAVIKVNKKAMWGYYSAVFTAILLLVGYKKKTKIKSWFHKFFKK